MALGVRPPPVVGCLPFVAITQRPRPEHATASNRGHFWAGRVFLRPHNAVEGVVGTPASLLSQWRERAAHLQQFGDPNSARLWHLAAAELERALASVADETLSLVEAARVSGYTADYLGHLIKTGKLPNAGRKGAPRIRRQDLPQKRSNGPGRPSPHDRAHIRKIARSFKEES
jgi:hypothetical protein